MKIFIRAKKSEFPDDLFGFQEFENPQDDSLYAPANQIVSIVTSLLTAGIANILVEIIKAKSKEIKVSITLFNDVKIDCTGCKKEEIIDVIMSIKEILTQDREKKAKVE